MDENKESRKVIKISKKKFIITISIIFLILIIWGAKSMMMNTFGVGRMTGSSIIPSVGISEDYYNPSSQNMMPPDYYDQGYQKPSISDTREFLKTNYSATIKTRDVAEVIRDVNNIIKGSDGRVDNSYSSEKSGRVSFVVAKSKFDEFKNQIESITHKKLYTETISSQNLLSQKQNIEGQTINIVSTLTNLQDQKANLDTKHTQSVTSINKELTRIRAELVAVRAVIATTTEPLVLDSFIDQENSLVKQENTQKQKLIIENNSYTAQNQSLENSINDANNGLINVNNQDSQFTDNIETVNGSIDVDWISLWEMTDIFSPISPFVIIIILVIVLFVYLKKRGTIPKIEIQ